MNRDVQTSLARWTEQGLLSPEQQAAILAAEQARPERGMSLTTIAQYFGGFMILFAYTVFWGLRWEELPALSQAGVALTTILVVGGIGVWLRQRGVGLGSSLLLFAATGVLPLLLRSTMAVLGVWPAVPLLRSAGFDYAAYWPLEARAWVILAGLTIIGTLLMLWWVRFALLTVLATGWGVVLVANVTRLVAGNDSGSTQQLVLAGYGAVLLGLAWWLGRGGDARGWSGVPSWLTLSGLIGVTGGLGSYALFGGDERWLAGWFFLAVHLVLVWLSARLSDRLLLVFGAIGTYLFVGKLALDTFRDSLGFPMTLGLIGLSLVLGAVAYQRLGGRLGGQPSVANRQSPVGSGQ